MSTPTRPESVLSASDAREVRPPETQVPRFWRPSVLASQLGLSRQSIYKLIRDGELQKIMIAGAIRVPESSVLAYLRRCEGGT